MYCTTKINNNGNNVSKREQKKKVAIPCKRKIFNGNISPHLLFMIIISYIRICVRCGKFSYGLCVS